MINLEKEIRQQPDVLASVRAANESVIDKIVCEIKSRHINGIYFAARGTSNHACVYAKYLFGIFAGMPCTLGTPSVFTKYGASVHLKDQLVIGVSQSGKAADALAIMESAKAEGAVTVAITNNADSPMAKSAAYHLFCNAGPETSIAATKTFTAQMLLLGLLCGKLSGNDELLSSLDSVSGKVAELLDTLPDKIESYAEKYKDIKSAVVLGRGTAYPIALEGALKILETNKIKMRGYATSDFHHGPAAQLGRGDLAIVLAVKGVTMDDSIEMLGKIDRIGADALVITDDSALAEKYTNSILIPDTGSEFTSPFLLAVTLQTLAMKLTVVRGIDPDVSDVLNKITITK